MKWYQVADRHWTPIDLIGRGVGNGVVKDREKDRERWRDGERAGEREVVASHLVIKVGRLAGVSRDGGLEGAEVVTALRE